LLYVVYLCQKSQNFVYALICYKQKCKVVSLNLAHPVYLCLAPLPRYSALSVENRGECFSFRFIFCSVLFSALFTEAERHTKVSIACLPFYRRLSRGHFDVRAIQAVINSDLIGAFMSCPVSHVLHDGMTCRIYRSREERVRCRSICYK